MPFFIARHDHHKRHSLQHGIVVIRPVLRSLANQGSQVRIAGVGNAIMVSVNDDDGFFIEATFFEIVKEGFDGTVQIVGCLEVAIDCFIFGFGQGETKLIANQIASIGIVIGHRDILGIKRLLQVL